MEFFHFVTIRRILGQPFLGPDLSPSLLHEQGLLQLLAECNWRIKQVPDFIKTSHQSGFHAEDLKLSPKNCRQVGQVCKVIKIICTMLYRILYYIYNLHLGYKKLYLRRIRNRKFLTNIGRRSLYSVRDDSWNNGI